MLPTAGKTFPGRPSMMWAGRPGQWRQKPHELGHLIAFNTYNNDIRWNQKIDLHELLRACHKFKASDPRDKIFALQGLTGAYLHLTLTINYNKPAREVMIDAARYFLDRNELCEVLFEAGVGWDYGDVSEHVVSTHQEQSLLSLPSWVPNWARSYYGTRLSKIATNVGGQTLNYGYSASGQSQSLMREGYRESLIASVVLLQDMIKSLGGIYRPPFDENGFCTDREGTEFTVTWHREAFNIARDAVAPYPVRGGELSRKEAFWRAYMGDRTRQQRPAPEDYNDLMSHWRRQMIKSLGESL
ncbi:hypothetical protein V2W45_1459593 [Cenococcum geophilum]